MARFPARLHVLLAREAPVGVVIRRGPSDAVCTVGWQRKRDEFQLGQWLRGRIYERRADLSPDGRYLIYFAMNGKWRSATKGSWTAISRVPYLKALVLHGKGDAWQGGGLFTGKYRYWLNGCHTLLQDHRLLNRDEKYRPQTGFGAECLGVYYPRLLRDGWRLTGRLANGIHDQMHVFEKLLGAGWTLRKYAHTGVDSPQGKGCYWDDHELVKPAGDSLPRRDWEWADVDGERLVWATDGKLFAGRMTKQGISGETLLADFNDMKFERIEATY